MRSSSHNGYNQTLYSLKNGFTYYVHMLCDQLYHGEYYRYISVRVKYIRKFAIHILLINLIGIYCNDNIVSLVRVLNMFYKVIITKVSVIILIMTQIVKFPNQN